MTTMPDLQIRTIDHRPLNGGGAGLWRHELWVPLPGSLRYAPSPLVSPGDRCTWTEITHNPAGGWGLSVVRYTGSPRLTVVQRGEMTGELAEAWWRLTARVLKKAWMNRQDGFAGN